VFLQQGSLIAQQKAMNTDALLKAHAPKKSQHLVVLKDKSAVLKEGDMVRNNKKAGAEMWFIVVGAVLALIVFGFGANLLAKVKNSFDDISPILMQNKDSICLQRGKTDMEKGVQFIDKDNDGRPDSCDICISYTNPQATANVNDGDADGMFSGCDENDNDRSIRKCKKGFTLVDEYRCVEGTPSK
jgi:hypothetical protein